VAGVAGTAVGTTTAVAIGSCAGFMTTGAAGASAFCCGAGVGVGALAVGAGASEHPCAMSNAAIAVSRFPRRRRGTKEDLVN
jgi:hypothetical protein